ncbi:hypothetical protein RDABS01_017392, partial [Bienertia sinuspersici]
GFSAGGTDLFLRLAASKLGKRHSHKMTAIITSVTITRAILVAVLIFFLRRWIMQRVRKREKAEGIPNKYNFEVGQLELQEPPFYAYDILRNATNNIDGNIKHGEGAFGSVYKGILESRQVRAVKRLSTSSGQGLEEFITKLKVISKLQHRNLVKF